MVDQPTTGDPAIDNVIREKMPEAVDLAYSILVDRHPDLDKKRAEKTAAIVVSQLLSPMMQIFIAGFKVHGEGFIDGEPE